MQTERNKGAPCMITVGIVCRYWLRFFCHYNVEQPKVPIQLTKYSQKKQASPLMSLDIIPIIMEYSRTPINYPINAKTDKFDYLSDDHKDFDSGWHGIIIDLGSGSIKCGLSGDEVPCKVFPPAVAYDEENNIIIGNDIEKYEKHEKRLHNKHYIIKRGIIQNFDEMLQVLKYIIDEIDADTLKKEGVFIINGSAYNDRNAAKAYFDKIAKMVYENFEIDGFQMSDTNSMSLYSTGRTTGIVVNCGYGLTHILPFYEGYPLTDIGKHIEFGKQDLIEMNIDQNEDKCMEYMFDTVKIHELTLNVLIEAKKQLKDVSICDIAIVGGNCMYKEFKDKFGNKFKKVLMTNEEAIQLGLTEMDFRFILPPDAGLSSWIGGSIISLMNTFQRNFVRYHQYKDRTMRLWIEEGV